MSKKYAVGIDLGTTNSVVAYLDLDADKPRIEVLPIPQVVAPGTTEARPMLPSFLYIPTAEERQGGIYDLPWGSAPAFVVGEWARQQSAAVPTRTVAAAKSWLCYSRVDRRQPILPWNAPEDVEKISPVTAARAYLEHMAAAWAQAFPDAPLADQQVVLTVPASFDVSARELTREAALAAGLPQDLVLLEEPQAALYAWLSDRSDKWRKELGTGDVLLVSDIGGGTTDFTIIQVESDQGELALRRIAVGNHILVGGDNMDLTLAHVARNQLADKGVEIDPWQAVSLWHACRMAKEKLLSDDGPDSQPVAILGRGTKVIGGSLKTKLERNAVAASLLDGFFPACKLADVPERRRASGFKELGLPFETDTAITRHLAAFLSRHGEEGRAVRPTHLLFNGGVLKAETLRERLREIVAGWFKGGAAPKVLRGNDDLDFAVGRGAAYYGYTKQREGVRIRGGAARSYYVGIETSGLAVPGAPRPLRALCVVPKGMEEGTEADVPGDEIGVIVGEPAHFRFFSSTMRKEDQPGALLSSWSPDELIETDSMETTLAAAEGTEEEFVPVRFRARITELGVFELWCVSASTGHQWKLEFSVRESGD